VRCGSKCRLCLKRSQTGRVEFQQTISFKAKTKEYSKSRQRSYNASQKQKSNPKTGKGHIMQGRGERVIQKQAKDI